MAKAKVKTEPRPKAGEETQAQKKGIGGGVTALFADFIGFAKPPLGIYKVYRQMRANPTVALARTVGTAPIRTATYSIAADDEVDDKRIQFIESQIKKLWPEFLKQLLLSLDYGWMPFEKVWEIDNEGHLVYGKLKPLLVDISHILINKDTGAFEGLRQGQVDLLPNKCFVFTYEGEAGNFYGRSRHENIRDTAWSWWTQVAEKSGQYFRKIAGIIPMVEYPEGTSLDKDGVEKNNFELAATVLQNLGKGNGVAMPNTMAKWAGDLSRSGVDISQLKAWHIQFLESKGSHGKQFTDCLRHLESLMMRGWLVPERAATEGQFGTKAESESHANLALVTADLVFRDVLRAVNRYIVNPLLIYNYGLDAKDTIRLECGGIDPLLKIFFRDLIKTVLSHPQNIDLFLTWVDIDSMLDKVELPKAQEVIETPITETPLPTQEEEEVPGLVPPIEIKSRAALQKMVRGWYAKINEALKRSER